MSWRGVAGEDKIAAMASRYPFPRRGSKEGGLEYSASSTVELVSIVLERSAAATSCHEKGWMIHRQAVARHDTLSSSSPSNRPRTATVRVLGSESTDAIMRSATLPPVLVDGMESRFVCWERHKRIIDEHGHRTHNRKR